MKDKAVQKGGKHRPGRNKNVNRQFKSFRIYIDSYSRLFFFTQNRDELSGNWIR